MVTETRRALEPDTADAGVWPDRTSLPSTTSTGAGTVICSSSADLVVNVAEEQRQAAVAQTAAVLAGAGLGTDDRVLVALAVDGAGSGALLLEAVRGVARSVCHVDPRGRTRLLAAVNAVAPSTLVITPTGAADLLARLHLEFLVDPMELGLRRIVVVGELASDAILRHLESEFDADVVQVWVEPVLGVGLGWRVAGSVDVDVVDETVLHLSRLDEDAATVGGSGLAEWTVELSRFAAVPELPFRTGYVADAPDRVGSGRVPVPVATVGDHLLIRGRWFSLPALERALRPIDGIAGWTLHISRSGTLDQAALTIALGRQSLVDNPMWESRLREAVKAVTPISVAVTTSAADGEDPAGLVCDERPQHLGRDRHLVGRGDGHD